ncbi:uncharacterized protein BDZ83DRAFT_57297 [Colletotrichum acutatum]|uniref:Uncharacterized protein n=1 Tax=Glomerella acutata TaxID=27357 RepID=A0AAD8UA29_GLOAC|nr:uncharacterized protein BDZ83DRAFT_57297 [Colletotrichum acutatum]KAK1715442.1 hypothetical protein BDZ83DRAFT_57297 [Colletotrichum acutatum]
MPISLLANLVVGNAVMGRLLQACSHRFKVSIGIRGSVVGCCASSNGEASCPTSTQRLGIDGYGTSGAQIQGHGANRPLVDRIQARVWQSSCWARCRNNRNEWLVYVICVAERRRAGQMFLPVRWEHHLATKYPNKQNGDGRKAEIQSAWPLVVGLHKRALHTAVPARGIQFLTATLPKPRVW